MLVVALSVSGVGVGSAAAAKNEVDAATLEALADDQREQHDHDPDRQVRDRPGLGERRLRADRRRGAERPVLGDYERDHGRHRPHPRRRHRRRLPRRGSDEPQEGRRVHLPGVARARFDAAGRTRREPLRHERGRLGRRQVGHLRRPRQEPGAEADDPDHGYAAERRHRRRHAADEADRRVHRGRHLAADADDPADRDRAGDLRGEHAAARLAATRGSCGRRRSARHSCRSASSTRRPGRPAALVVKGNLVAVLSPNEWEAIGAAAAIAGTTKWSDWQGLPGSGNLYKALRSRRLHRRHADARPEQGRRGLRTRKRGEDDVGHLRARRTSSTARSARRSRSRTSARTAPPTSGRTRSIRSTSARCSRPCSRRRPRTSSSASWTARVTTAGRTPARTGPRRMPRSSRRRSAHP